MVVDTTYSETSHEDMSNNDSIQKLTKHTDIPEDKIHDILANVLNETNSGLEITVNEVTRISSEIDSMKDTLSTFQETNGSVYDEMKLLKELMKSTEQVTYSINKTLVAFINATFGKFNEQSRRQMV